MNSSVKALSLLSLIFTLFNTNIGHTYECAHEVVDTANYTRSASITMLSNTGVKLSEDRIAVWNKFFEYQLTKECVDSMDVEVYQGTSGRIYVELTSTEDQCDGGNTYGVILDLNNNVVGDIGDGDYYCR